MVALTRHDIKPIIGGGARTHENCRKQYNCNRPGKTAVDKSRGNYTTGKNVRHWDNSSRTWMRA